MFGQIERIRPWQRHCRLDHESIDSGQTPETINRGMQGLPQQPREIMKQTSKPKPRRRVSEMLRALLGWRPSVLVLPRGQVHWMTLDVRGVPSRFILSSLRLQLRQLLGDGKFGFAYRLRADTARLWYWSEADTGEFARIRAGQTGEIAPWPESLLRSPLQDGIHLLASQDGFEALSVLAQEIVRTRWFATLPTADAWASFVRDAGLDPQHHPLPVARETKLQPHPPRGWKLSTSLIQPIPYTIWAGAAAIALTGLLLCVGGSYSLKLENEIATERVTYEKLAKENASTIALQKQINQKVAYLNGFSGTRPPIPQLNLMKAILDSGLVTEEAKISLAEWEYRNNRLRLLFSVPQDEFSLGAFLTVLEKQPALRDIKLMPDTPPLTVGIQAALGELRKPEYSEKKPLEAAASTILPTVPTTPDRR